jgi:hypothetical protein
LRFGSCTRFLPCHRLRDGRLILTLSMATKSHFLDLWFRLIFFVICNIVEYRYECYIPGGLISLTKLLTARRTHNYNSQTTLWQSLFLAEQTSISFIPGQSIPCSNKVHRMIANTRFLDETTLGIALLLRQRVLKRQARLHEAKFACRV